MSAKSKSKRKSAPIELKELEETVGQFMEYWGFKSIHGRIWAHLYTAVDPLDSQELMNRLGVSKGLMSLAIRELLHYDVIKNDHVAKYGTAFYVANPDLFAVITNVLRQREIKMLSRANKCATALKKMSNAQLESTGLDAGKIQSVVELTESAQLLLKTFLVQDDCATDGAIFKII